MVNLITEKVHSNTNYKPLYNVSAQSGVQKPKEKELSQPQNKIKNLEKNIIPLSLLTGGGIFLYYGIKSPGKVKIFKNMVHNRLFKMEADMNEFITYSKRLVEATFNEPSEYIKNYKKQNYINPISFFINIKMIDHPNLIAKAQDLAFEALNKNNPEAHRLGASEMDNFASQLEALRRKTLSLIEQKKERTKLIIGDYVHLPKFKNGEHSDLVENAENQLLSMVTSLSEQMENIKDKKLKSVIKNLYKDMAEAIIEARKLRTNAKANIIDESFKHMRNLLKLPQTFIPSYYKIPTLENFEKLTAEELKPRTLPLELKNAFQNNLYIDVLRKKDFAEITNDDLYKIFYSTPYENNLQDLRFLIDRIRIRQVASKDSNTNNEYKIIIGKLEYLANKLNDFGTNEILKRSQADFNNMSVEQRRAKLYYISSVSRRLGFDTINEMDEYFSKHNSTYNELNIREYMDTFKSNPDYYFY